MYYLSLDKPVYSNEEKTQVIEGPISVSCTTRIPLGVYFDNTEYNGEGRNDLGGLLYNVTFTVPDHLITEETTQTLVGASYS